MDLLTPPEAAVYLKISPRMLAQYRAEGGGPSFSRLFADGRGVRYRRDDLDRWVSDRLIGQDGRRMCGDRLTAVRSTLGGFAVDHNGRQLAYYPDAVAANAHACRLHETNMAMREMGEVMGLVDTPPPILQLWIDGVACAAT